MRRYRESDFDEVLANVCRHWQGILETVRVKTPDRIPSIFSPNRWLPYQILSCRMWARAAFYQAGGAYGFRDQLQDAMALAVSDPSILKEQLLRSAARQFPEGDVQHWWHPPSGRGVRTHCSDDRVWLPYAVLHYLETTGDNALMETDLPFLEDREIPEGSEDIYFDPKNSDQTGNLYEHCARALDRSLSVGSHGLPLMGSGDWNDGMNRVGILGKGESVWLAWFLIPVLRGFADVAAARGDSQRAENWRRCADALKESLEKNAWDGDWYRRAYFDSGAPLGSASNDECRIDSIAQSWAVLSGEGDPARCRQAMLSVEQYLVRRGDDLVLLFTPPFHFSQQDPGYIKSYLPGVRENGGQYTHAAVWTAAAFAAMGEGDRASDLFSMLNPINHTGTRAGVYRYKVEPYVMAGDVYAEPPHVGRGGWTWYTGSAGWMHRAGLEWILGFRLKGKSLQMDPCIPKEWQKFEISYRRGSATYDITVLNPQGRNRAIAACEVDGEMRNPPPAMLDLADDGRAHQIRLTLG